MQYGIVHLCAAGKAAMYLPVPVNHFILDKTRNCVIKAELFSIKRRLQAP